MAKRILLGFLAQNDDVFRMGKGQLAAGLPGLRLTDYRVSRFFRAATFMQWVGALPVIESRTQALFDANWNVIGITRTLYTPAKLKIAPTRTIPRAKAVATARRTVADLTGKDPKEFVARTVVLGLEPMRRERTWQVQMVGQTSPEFDFTVLMRAATGQVMNVSDNVDAFTDAKTRRWGYVGGDQTQPYQIISTGVYTRDDNTLRHDFFFLETDERGGGILGQFQCDAADTSTKSVWRAFAWGTNSSPFSYIRHTHRSDRDFSIWSPAHASGSFGESHTYYWSRQYFQWMKPALLELGVLPENAADYPKATIIDKRLRRRHRQIELEPPRDHPAQRGRERRQDPPGRPVPRGQRAVRGLRLRPRQERQLRDLRGRRLPSHSQRDPPRGQPPRLEGHLRHRQRPQLRRLRPAQVPARGSPGFGAAPGLLALLVRRGLQPGRPGPAVHRERRARPGTRGRGQQPAPFRLRLLRRHLALRGGTGCGPAAVGDLPRQARGGEPDPEHLPARPPTPTS